MKKLLLLTLAITGLGAFAASANAHDCDDDRGYRSYGRSVYYVDRGRSSYDERDYRCEPTYYSHRRVYVNEDYPRHYRPRVHYYHRPAVSFSFGF